MTQTIKIIDKENHQPVAYAHVFWQSLSSKDNGYVISTPQGIADFTFKKANEKIAINISYVGYQIYLDTIASNSNKTIKLKSNNYDLSEVVVTGVLKPTPKDSSIYKVKIISSKEIKMSGAANLCDLLQTEPNINISTDLILGSKIEMMGMSGENVKLMVDGVPVIGRLDGNIDLSQLNLSNIDHVEIVEGPSSVVYGNNALAGSINLISKTGETLKNSLTTGVQLETAGKFDGELFASHTHRNQTFTFNTQASKFLGIDFDKNNRSMDWKPAKNIQLGLGYRLKNNTWQLHSTLLGYYGDILMKGDIVNIYKAYDTYYYTRRLNWQGNAIRQLRKNSFIDILTAYSYYDRSSQELYKNLSTIETKRNEKILSQNNRSAILRAIYGQQLFDSKLNLQTGIDLHHESMGGNRLVSSYEAIGDYAAFVNVNYKISAKIELQPGVRYAYNTKFQSPIVYSLNGKYNINKQLIWRATAAKGFRAPSLKELYYEFVNSNHLIYGNSELKAESSENFFTSLDFKNSKLTTGNISLYFNNIHNKIELVETRAESNFIYQNITNYQSLGGNFDIGFYLFTHLKINLGTTLTGRITQYGVNFHSRSTDFSPDILGKINYLERHSKISFHADYKFTGKKPYFYQTYEGNFEKGEQYAYQILNISANRNFLKNKLQAVIGVRNFLDVTSVKLSGVNSAIIHASGNVNPITYGRSFFIHLVYSI